MKEMKFLDETKLFFTSDSHWNHKNIIEYCKRPFSSVEEMNETLVNNWNKTVPEDGIVFHLGDIALGRAKTWNEILPRLNGTIHLILGNHDRKNIRAGYEQYFASINEQLTIEVGKKALILTHFPLLCYHGTWGTEMNIWNLIGHVHTLKHDNSGKDFERLQYLFPTQYDVGVDFNDYRPISFSEVEEKIKYQIKNNVNMLCWIK